MYTRILVPLDGSPFSEEIIPYAASLAALHETELLLLHVIDKASRQNEGTRYIDRVASAHKAQGKCLLAPGDVAQTLLKEFDHQPDTLLAMTSRGHSGLAEAILGSVAQRVMRSAKKPVLMYHPTGKRPSGDSPVRLNRVILPLDGSDLTERIAADAAGLARWIGADLELITVIGPRSAANVGELSEGEMTSLESGYLRSKASQLGKQHGVEVQWDVLYGDPTEAITSHVGNRRDVILAMATRRQDALEAALLGSITAGCLRKAGVPILMRLP